MTFQWKIFVVVLQMPTYSPADSMFYNLPVYGTAMDVPPVYTEAFDLGAGGPYGEVSICIFFSFRCRILIVRGVWGILLILSSAK